MFPEAARAIPGAKRANQAEENITAAGLPPLFKKTMAAIAAICDPHARTSHRCW